MVEGGMKCVKFLLFVFNLIFLIAGIALIVTGAVVQTKFKDMFIFFEGSSFSSAAILLIVVGCIILVLGFFGCCGALKENHCMVMTFAVTLIIIFIIEIGVGIAAFVMKNNVEQQVQKTMKKTLDQYTKSAGVKDTWDRVQNMFTCCGVNSSDDWIGKGINTTYPVSCCKKEFQKEGPICTKDETNIKKEGCVKGFKHWVESNIYIVAGVGVGLAFIQLIGVIFACCLARAIKKEYEVV